MKVVTCPCGEQISGETDDEIVEAVNQHLQESHPDLAGKYSREQILSMAQDQ
jgi:predicted small metal-binding protein